MTKSEDTNKELSMDELTDVSGGIRTQGGGYKAKGKSNKSLGGPKENGFTDKSTPQSCTSEGDRSLEDINF